MSINSFALLQVNSSPPYGMIVQSNGFWKQQFKSIPRAELERNCASVETEGDDRLFLYPLDNWLLCIQTDKTETVSEGNQRNILNELTREIELSGLWSNN